MALHWVAFNSSREVSRCPLAVRCYLWEKELQIAEHGMNIETTIKMGFIPKTDVDTYSQCDRFSDVLINCLQEVIDLKIWFFLKIPGFPWNPKRKWWWFRLFGWSGKCQPPEVTLHWLPRPCHYTGMGSFLALSWQSNQMTNSAEEPPL